MIVEVPNELVERLANKGQIRRAVDDFMSFFSEHFQDEIKFPNYSVILNILKNASTLGEWKNGYGENILAANIIAKANIPMPNKCDDLEHQAHANFKSAVRYLFGHTLEQIVVARGKKYLKENFKKALEVCDVEKMDKFYTEEIDLGEIGLNGKTLLEEINSNENLEVARFFNNRTKIYKELPFSLNEVMPDRTDIESYDSLKQPVAGEAKVPESEDFS